MHRRGIDGRRDIHEPQIAGAGGELEIPHIADERDIGVVNRDRQLRLIVERRRRVLLRRRLGAGLGGNGGLGLGPAEKHHEGRKGQRRRGFRSHVCSLGGPGGPPFPLERTGSEFLHLGRFRLKAETTETRTIPPEGGNYRIGVRANYRIL